MKTDKSIAFHQFSRTQYTPKKMNLRLFTKSLAPLIIFSFFTICFFTFPANSQIPQKVKTWYKYGKKAYGLANNFMTNYNWCRTQGYSEAHCNEAATLCTTFDFVSNNAPGIQGKIFQQLQLFQAFKPYCAGGVCFQCCFTGGGCHSSFVGFPVINCNYNYGPETRPAGLTLVLSGQPGDPCLFTPQTCNHLALCLSGNSPSQIENINNNPNHVIKSQNAKDQRARHYAEDFLEDRWSHFLSTFSTEQPLNTDSITIIGGIKVTDVFDFLTARGNPYWGEWIDSLSIISLDQPAFGIYDTTTNQFLDGPSRWNFNRQIGLARLLASIPNIRERLDFTGSFIWTDSTLMNYLNPIGNPDSFLLTQMSPLAYYFLNKNPKNQDYRLLAPPLQNEMLSLEFYGGDDLGKAPILQTEKTSLDSNQLSLTLSIFSPGTHNSNYPFSGIVYWGDGTVTEFEIPDFLTQKNLMHTYRDTGKYQAITVLQNSSGLRSVKFDEVNIQSPYSFEIPECPIVNELWFYDLVISTSLFTFTEKIGLDLTTKVDSNTTTLGRVGVRTFNNNTAINFDTAKAFNTSLFELDSIVFEPLFINDDQTAFTRLSFSHLKGLIYNPITEQDTLISLPLIKDSIRVYDNEGNYRSESFFVEENVNTGVITVFIEYDTVNLSKVVIPIDKDSLKNFYLSPVNSNTWTGNDTLYVEQRPDVFEVFSLPICGLEVMNISEMPIPAQVYQSNGTIYSIGTVQTGDTVVFIAGDSILLLSDFFTELGSEFEAKIANCSPPMISLGNQNHMPVKAEVQTPSIQFRREQEQILIQNKGAFYFYLPQASEIELQLIHNTNNQLQKMLIENLSYPPGQHRFEFKELGLPSGTYRLLFKVNGKVEKIERLSIF